MLWQLDSIIDSFLLISQFEWDEVQIARVITFIILVVLKRSLAEPLATPLTFSAAWMRLELLASFSPSSRTRQAHQAKLYFPAWRQRGYPLVGVRRSWTKWNDLVQIASSTAFRYLVSYKEFHKHNNDIELSKSTDAWLAVEPWQWTNRRW